MALPVQDKTFKRTGTGSLYLFPMPADADSVDDFMTLLYGSSNAAKRKGAPVIPPVVNATESGLNIKVKPSTVEFKPCTSPKTKLVTGIDEATAEVSFYDVTPAVLNLMFGGQAADLVKTVASTGVAGRTTVIIGPSSLNTPYAAIWRMAHPVLKGEYWHYVLTNATIVADLDLKLGRNNAYEAKVSFQLDGHPALVNSEGNGAIMVSDDPDAVAL